MPISEEAMEDKIKGKPSKRKITEPQKEMDLKTN